MTARLCRRAFWVAALASAAVAAPLLAHAQTIATNATALTPVTGTATLAADLSLTNMVANADKIVRSVMAGLALASIVSWTILIAKSAELIVSGRDVKDAYRLADEGIPDQGHRTPRALALMRSAVRLEIAASIGAPASGTKERLASRLHRIEVRLARKAQRGTGILATVGAIAPFVGLFGTVWGIMNSFIGIARLHTTNLAVVAPGIAEALLATAMGLVAAIPAVVIYNIFSRWTAGYRAGLADLSETVLRHAARSLDLRSELHLDATRPARQFEHTA